MRAVQAWLDAQNLLPFMGKRISLVLKPCYLIAKVSPNPAANAKAIAATLADVHDFFAVKQFVDVPFPHVFGSAAAGPWGHGGDGRGSLRAALFVKKPAGAGLVFSAGTDACQKQARTGA